MSHHHQPIPTTTNSTANPAYALQQQQQQQQQQQPIYFMANIAPPSIHFNPHRQPFGHQHAAARPAQIGQLRPDMPPPHRPTPHFQQQMLMNSGGGWPSGIPFPPLDFSRPPPPIGSLAQQPMQPAEASSSSQGVVASLGQSTADEPVEESDLFHAGEQQQILQRAQLRMPMPNKEKIYYELPPVPAECRGKPSPCPAYRRTIDGRDFLCFFTNIYAFSNHYATEFEIDKITYYSSEQYYMYRKAQWFGFEMTASEIMESRDSSVIKRLGNADTLRQRKREGLEPSSHYFDHSEWAKEKVEVMKTALWAKFEQNQILYDMLKATGNSYLVESSPSDFFWGIGLHMNCNEIRNPDEWPGENRMGRLLMELRSEFHMGQEENNAD